MADKTPTPTHNSTFTKPARKRGPNKPKTPVDLMHQVFLVFNQTAARMSVEAFTGPDAEEAARARAREKAASTKALVAIFGPQVGVYGPPESPAAVEVDLDWQN